MNVKPWLSSNFPICSRLASQWCGAEIEMPIGKPRSLGPEGTVSTGWPLKLYKATKGKQ